jgi:hypothetical protein
MRFGLMMRHVKKRREFREVSEGKSRERQEPMVIIVFSLILASKHLGSERLVLSIFVALATAELLLDYAYPYCPLSLSSSTHHPSLSSVFRHVSPTSLQRKY